MRTNIQCIVQCIVLRIGLAWLVALACAWSAQSSLAQTASSECVTWERVLPPTGIEIPADKAATWQKRIDQLDKQLAGLAGSPFYADIDVLVKACKLAIQYREFYTEKDFAKCDRLLALAEQRMQWPELKQRKSSSAQYDLPGTEGQQRLQARGFTSAVDGSSQPIGLIMPAGPAPAGKKLPLYVWLHGRGDKSTDLHFLCERLDKKGEVAPEDAITLHPFGRQCVGYKNAGSTDVMEAIDFVVDNYPVDTRKIVLIGFSMGGAGAWHLAAHYSDRFVAASPGAGFAETARYQNLTPDKYPPKVVQTLWSVYDVPDYTRNLFNLPVIAYSGENDKQIQAARVMEEAFKAEGRTLEHLIGPGMGHKYHPDVLKELLAKLGKIADEGKPANPSSIHLQTRHWRFASRDWITVDGIEQPYSDTRVDATRDGTNQWSLKTKNVSRLELSAPAGAKLTIDGKPVKAPATTGTNSGVLQLTRQADGAWQAGPFAKVRKHAGLSGPIDDAFFDPFVFVTPTGKSSNAALDQWVKCEMQYAIDRWTALMRGKPRVMRDVDVKPEDMDRYSLVLWGDAESNQLIQRLLNSSSVPLAWSKTEIKLGQQKWSATDNVPVLILPNPESPNRYIVLNSGLTFRDAHDRTNSLQNPQLPDWAILSLGGPRSANAAGPVVASGFFNDSWKYSE